MIEKFSNDDKSKRKAKVSIITSGTIEEEKEEDCCSHKSKEKENDLSPRTQKRLLL